MGPFEKAKYLYERAIEKKTDESDLDMVINWKGEELSALFSCTDMVRRQFFGNSVESCAIMNIKSGGCPEDCAFCSQSVHNSVETPVTTLSGKDEIIQSFKEASAQNLTFGVVSSGKRLTSDEVLHVTEALAACGEKVHASLGILGREEFAMLRSAGVACYNHNLETSRDFFSKTVTTHSYDDRVDTVKRAKEAGMAVCCGGIFGMGETWEDRKSLCLELKRLDVDKIPINFLNAVPGTRVPPPQGVTPSIPEDHIPIPHWPPRQDHQGLRGEGSKPWEGPKSHVLRRGKRFHLRGLSDDKGRQRGIGR